MIATGATTLEKAPSFVLRKRSPRIAAEEPLEGEDGFLPGSLDTSLENSEPAEKALSPLNNAPCGSPDEFAATDGSNHHDAANALENVRVRAIMVAHQGGSLEESNQPSSAGSGSAFDNALSEDARVTLELTANAQ